MTNPLRVVLAGYAAALQDIQAVRIAVFVVEQQLPLEEEFDDRDPLSQHAVVYDCGMAVGTGRMDPGQDGRIGRVAVLPEFRRRGIGRQVMQVLEQTARQQGVPRLWFHAQVSAVPFYMELGYELDGEEFLELDIPHVLMQKRLSS
ncbi:MAG: GNAT family N-acetyltransferase [Planctomycetaceae bacterium]